jgi:hypothetical protein
MVTVGFNLTGGSPMAVAVPVSTAANVTMIGQCRLRRRLDRCGRAAVHARTARSRSVVVVACGSGSDVGLSRPSRKAYGVHTRRCGSPGRVRYAQERRPMSERSIPWEDEG